MTENIDLSVHRIGSRRVVSVITPCFNGGRFLDRVVECVAMQGYDLEHILVDDGSTDDTWAKILVLADRFDWIRPLKLSRNCGPSIARNAAIRMSTGKYLAFLDVDDIWLPEKLSVQIEFMEREECALSFTDYRFISDDGSLVGWRFRGFNQIGWNLHHMTRSIGCLTVIVDHEKIPEFSFPEIGSDLRAEDFLAWSSCIAKYGNAVRCPHDLARYSIVLGSRSSNKVNGSLKIWRIYRKVEKIPVFLSMIFFMCYVLHAFWKRYYYAPRTINF
jgi:teichuronic acid biosynthesis glycosyltransferase TuaG